MTIKLSIITPTYNREDTILTCINSIKKQTSFPFWYEHIIIDDASKDHTLQKIKTVKDTHIKIISLKKNKGVNGARNAGIRAAKGNYILLLDSDDYIIEKAFSTMQKHEKDFKEMNVFGTQCKGKDLSYIKKSKHYTYKEWLEGKHIKGEFLNLVKTSVLQKILFDEEKMCFEGYTWNKIIKKYGVMAFKEQLRQYTFSDNSISKELLLPKNAQKRTRDYHSYIEAYEQDYVKFKLYSQLSFLYQRQAIFLMLAGKSTDAKNKMKKSIQYKNNLQNQGIFFLMNLGRKAFLQVYSILIKFQ